MTTHEFIIDLLCRVDTKMQHVPKHAHASLYPSALVTLALVFALKGVGPRAFYRWRTRHDRTLFPKLPQRPRLVRCPGVEVLAVKVGGRPDGWPVAVAAVRLRALALHGP